MDNTLSIVPSETANEFPVLKAFQEYIDAEQAKARKRMLGLSIFFIVLLIVVVVTFVLVLTTVVNRNQALSDKLLDYALKEHDRATVAPVIQQLPTQAPPQQKIDPQEILKPFIERMEREQAEMKASYEKQQREAAVKTAAAEAARAEELKKVKAELEKERAKIQKENERQEAIERHRRRLYPDYYRIEQNPAPPSAPAAPVQATVPQPPPARPPARQSIDNSAKPRRQQQSSNPPPAKKSPSSLSSIKPVTYFNMDDEDGVPFILETPQQNK